MSNEKNVLISVDDIKNRVAAIDREMSEIYERECRDGRLPDREYLAELRDEKFTLKKVLEVIAEFPLDEIQEELDKRDPMREELGEDGLGSFSFYVLAHAEKVLQHTDKELQARVDLGERVISQWEKEFKNLSWEEDKAAYAIIRDKDVPFERLEEQIRKCLIRMNADLQKDLCDIGGRRCLKVDEWKDGEDVFVLGNSVSDGEFYYAEVNGKISNCFEYDFRPSREQVEEDWMNQQAMRAIDEHEAEFGADGFLAFPGNRDETKGNSEFYKMFYAGDGQQDDEAYAFQKETGWHMLWGSDYQGLNGDTWVVYRDVADLPQWLRAYAREEEDIAAAQSQKAAAGSDVSIDDDLRNDGAVENLTADDAAILAEYGLLETKDEYRYQMLLRLKADCDYYLGNGNRFPLQLWARSEKDQIMLMKALWNSFPDDMKPEWLSPGKLEYYEKRLLSVDTILSNAQVRADSPSAGREDPEWEMLR